MCVWSGGVYNVKGRWWCIRGGSPRGDRVKKWLGPTEAVCRKPVGSIARAINLARSCFAEIVSEDKEIVEIDLATAVQIQVWVATTESIRENEKVVEIHLATAIKVAC